MAQNLFVVPVLFSFNFGAEVGAKLWGQTVSAYTLINKLSAADIDT